MPPKPIKFVIVTDVHFGNDKPHDGQLKTISSQAFSLLKYVVRHSNVEVKPDFVVQLGSLIAEEDAEIDEDNYSRGIDVLKQLKMPGYHAVGASEQINLNLKQLGSILEYPKLHYSFDSGAWHFVVLCASSTNGGGVHIDQAQRKWLAEDLEATKLPTIVFSHYPLDDQEGFENLVEERVEIRQLLASSGKVRAVFSGHVHKNGMEVHDGVHYVTLQSLVSNLSDTRKLVSESFAIVSLTPSEIRVEVEGMDRAEYRI